MNESYNWFLWCVKFPSVPLPHPAQATEVCRRGTVEEIHLPDGGVVRMEESGKKVWFHRSRAFLESGGRQISCRSNLATAINVGDEVCVDVTSNRCIYSPWPEHKHKSVAKSWEMPFYFRDIPCDLIALAVYKNDSRPQVPSAAFHPHLTTPQPDRPIYAARILSFDDPCSGVGVKGGIAELFLPKYCKPRQGKVKLSDPAISNIRYVTFHRNKLLHLGIPLHKADLRYFFSAKAKGMNVFYCLVKPADNPTGTSFATHEVSFGWKGSMGFAYSDGSAVGDLRPTNQCVSLLFPNFYSHKNIGFMAQNGLNVAAFESIIEGTAPTRDVSGGEGFDCARVTQIFAPGSVDNVQAVCTMGTLEVESGRQEGKNGIFSAAELSVFGFSMQNTDLRRIITQNEPVYVSMGEYLVKAKGATTSEAWIGWPRVLGQNLISIPTEKRWKLLLFLSYHDLTLDEFMGAVVGSKRIKGNLQYIPSFQLEANLGKVVGTKMEFGLSSGIIEVTKGALAGEVVPFRSNCTWLLGENMSRSDLSRIFLSGTNNTVVVEAVKNMYFNPGEPRYLATVVYTEFNSRPMEGADNSGVARKNLPAVTIWLKQRNLDREIFKKLVAGSADPIETKKSFSPLPTPVTASGAPPPPPMIVLKPKLFSPMATPSAAPPPPTITRAQMASSAPTVRSLPLKFPSPVALMPTAETPTIVMAPKEAESTSSVRNPLVAEKPERSSLMEIKLDDSADPNFNLGSFNPFNGGVGMPQYGPNMDYGPRASRICYAASFSAQHHQTQGLEYLIRNERDFVIATEISSSLNDALEGYRKRSSSTPEAAVKVELVASSQSMKPAAVEKKASNAFVLPTPVPAVSETRSVVLELDVSSDFSEELSKAPSTCYAKLIRSRFGVEIDEAAFGNVCYDGGSKTVLATFRESDMNPPTSRIIHAAREKNAEGLHIKLGVLDPASGRAAKPTASPPAKTAVTFSLPKPMATIPTKSAATGSAMKQTAASPAKTAVMFSLPKPMASIPTKTAATGSALTQTAAPPAKDAATSSLPKPAAATPPKAEATRIAMKRTAASPAVTSSLPKKMLTTTTIAVTTVSAMKPTAVSPAKTEFAASTKSIEMDGEALPGMIPIFKSAPLSSYINLIRNKYGVTITKDDLSLVQCKNNVIVANFEKMGEGSPMDMILRAAIHTKVPGLNIKRAGSLLESEIQAKKRLVEQCHSTNIQGASKQATAATTAKTAVTNSLTKPVATTPTKAAATGSTIKPTSAPPVRRTVTPSLTKRVAATTTKVTATGSTIKPTSAPPVRSTVTPSLTKPVAATTTKVTATGSTIKPTSAPPVRSTVTPSLTKPVTTTPTKVTAKGSAMKQTAVPPSRAAVVPSLPKSSASTPTKAVYTRITIKPPASPAKTAVTSREPRSSPETKTLEMGGYSLPGMIPLFKSAPLSSYINLIKNKYGVTITKDDLSVVQCKSVIVANFEKTGDGSPMDLILQAAMVEKVPGLNIKMSETPLEPMSILTQNCLEIDGTALTGVLATFKRTPLTAYVNLIRDKYGVTITRDDLSVVQCKNVIAAHFEKSGEGSPMDQILQAAMHKMLPGLNITCPGSHLEPEIQAKKSLVEQCDSTNVEVKDKVNVLPTSELASEWDDILEDA
jgi:hypothetical protein